MAKIWYRNPSKSGVIGRCGGDEKNEWPRRTDKSWTLKKNNNKKISINITDSRYRFRYEWSKVYLYHGQTGHIGLELGGLYMYQNIYQTLLNSLHSDILYKILKVNQTGKNLNRSRYQVLTNPLWFTCKILYNIHWGQVDGGRIYVRLWAICKTLSVDLCTHITPIL